MTTPSNEKLAWVVREAILMVAKLNDNTPGHYTLTAELLIDDDANGFYLWNWSHKQASGGKADLQ